MSKTVQWKRGNANVSASYIGAQGEITVDTSEWGLRIHDGLTAGGYKISNDTDGNVNVGNININNQTIQGKNSNQDVQIAATGAANVVLFGQTTVVSNDMYVQGNGTIDEILIQNSTISTVNPNVNLVLTSGNVSTSGNFYANILRLKNENFYIAEVFSGTLSRNVTSIFSGLSYPQDITIRANNTIVGLHTSAVGTVGIRSFASNSVPVIIGGNTLVQGNVTANGYSAPEYSGYLFTSNAASVSGITHRIFSNTSNVNIVSILHNNSEVARFFSNNQTQLTGNLIVTGGPGVSNQTTFPEARLQIYSNVNSYSQIVHQNLNTQSLSSSDYVGTANNGTDTTYYVDLGIAGNLHVDPAFFGDTNTFNDAYLYAVGYNQAGPSLGNVGNLIIGSTNGLVKTFVGNTAQANVVTVVDSTGFIPGANVTYNLGSATRQWKDLWLSNSTLYLGGFPITVSNTGVLSVNGSPVTSNASSYGNANVSTLLAAFGSNTIVTTGNITGGNIVTGGTILGNYTFSQSGNTSAYATKRILQYVPGTGAVTYSNDIDASSIYITGYAIEIHVSPSALDDTGNGTIGTPVKTIARAQVLAAQAFETSSAGQRKTIILHPGDYPENVTISTQYTVLTTHELVGKNTTLSGTLTITKGCTIDGLKINNLVVSADDTTGTVDIIGCTVTTAVTKTSSAYTNFRGCDLSSATLSITGSGTTVMAGGNYFTLAVNNAAAGVLAKSVLTMGPVTLTAGTLQLSDTLIYAAANTANAITQSAGSVITVNNCQTLIPSLTNVARNSFGGFYSILNAVYDKANSTFAGTSLNAILYSQYINADNISATGNVTGGNLTTGGLISATGNITASYFIGNGSLLTGLASSTYSNANVALYMTTYGGPINANIITGTANATINGLTVNTSGVFTTTLQAAGGLQATPIGNAAASTGQFTTVNTTGNITGAALTSNTSITAITTISALGGLQNTPIGNVTASTGQFTTANATGNITGSALTINNSATIGTTLGVTGNATVGNLSTVGVIVGNASPGAAGTISNAVGYLGIPQNSQSTNYTLALTDQGRHIYLTANSNITIPANSSVSFPIGSAISVVNGPNVRSNVLITSDTLYLAANGATGTRSISTYGMFTLVKVTNTVWYINGSGIT